MLVSNDLVSRMRPGSVLVDISIDQGGCFEDSRPTTHDDPTYPVHDSVFYCVANMPGAVPHTSTYALTNVTLPYAVELADRGWRDALRRDHALGLGLNTHAEPTYQVHQSVFYCVANMPGAVPNTSTYALTNVTLPYALNLADFGWQDAIRLDPALALGVNTYDGALTYAPVAQAHGLPHRELTDILG